MVLSPAPPGAASPRAAALPMPAPSHGPPPAPLGAKAVGKEGRAGKDGRPRGARRAGGGEGVCALDRMQERGEVSSEDLVLALLLGG